MGEETQYNVRNSLTTKFWNAEDIILVPIMI